MDIRTPLDPREVDPTELDAREADPVDEIQSLVELEICGQSTLTDDGKSLAALVASGSEVRQQAEEWRHFFSLLEDMKIEAAPNFIDIVMERVETERARPRLQHSAWAAAALFVLFFGGAMLLVGANYPSAGSTVSALRDFVVTSALAGAGMLGATWKGVGVAVSSWMAASLLNGILFTVGVVGLNVLAISLLRSRQKVLAPAPRRSR